MYIQEGRRWDLVKKDKHRGVVFVAENLTKWEAAAVLKDIGLLSRRYDEKSPC